MGAAPNSFSSVLPQAPGNAIPEAALRAWTWGPFWSWLFWPFWNGDTLLKGLAVGAFVLSFFTGGLTALALAIYLGVRGNRIAAAFRQFSSVDEFFVVQRAWSRWGLILTIIGVVIPLGLFMLGMIFSIFINGVSEHHYS